MRAAFPSIVGSGENSVILHYRDNKRKMQNGDVLLMDIGAEYGYYAADITRSIPVNGQFNKQQKAIYEIERVKPVAEKYMNTGIRIEDDILVTPEGKQVLSAKAPKDIKTVEAVMLRKSIFNR